MNQEEYRMSLLIKKNKSFAKLRWGEVFYILHKIEVKQYKLFSDPTNILKCWQKYCPEKVDQLLVVDTVKYSKPKAAVSIEIWLIESDEGGITVPTPANVSGSNLELPAVTVPD